MINSKTKKIVVSLGLFFTLTFSITSIALAAEGYQPLVSLPGVQTKGEAITATETGDLSSYAKNIFYLLLGIAGVLAVVKIVIGGIEYMSSDIIGNKTEGKDIINQALYGLIIALAAWLILNSINPQLLNFNLGSTPNYNYYPLGGGSGLYVGQTPPSGSGYYIQINDVDMGTVYAGPYQDQNTCTNSINPNAKRPGGQVYNDNPSTRTCVSI